MNFRNALVHLKFLFARYRVNRPAYATFGDWMSCIYSGVVDISPVPLPSGARLVQCPRLGHPVELRLATSDWFTFEELFQHQEYQPLIDHLSTAPRLILDLGVNIGLSVALWQKTWPEAEIVGVEPDAENLAQAQKNSRTSATFVQAFVGGRPREAYLDRSGASAAFSLTDTPSAGAAPLPVMTVPQLLAAQESLAIDLLKCDIEGTEAEVFGNCAPWIGRVKHLAVEVHPPYTQARLLADLQAAGSSLKLFHVSGKGGVEVLFFCGAACAAAAEGRAHD